MTIFIGADHRGFELKNKLIEYLQEKNIRVEDLGNYQHDPLDDYPDFAQKVSQAVLQKPKDFGHKGQFVLLKTILYAFVKG
jgi:ribose 5-phosphate isomerase B